MYPKILIFSDLEAKELILNVVQGSPREELPTSPHERHSPLQQTHHCRPTTAQQPKYHQSRNVPSAIITPPSSSLAEDEFTDSNGGANVYPTAPPDYPSVFLSNFGNDEGYYHQDLFYHYSEQETVQHGSVTTTAAGAIQQQRPFSASSSSCSSDSEHTQQNFHLQTLGNPYYDSVHHTGGHHHGHHFSNNGFFTGSSNQTNIISAHQTVYGHELHGHQSPGNTASAGYTSVIQCPYV